MIAAAYRALAEEGLVEIRPRSGPFIATIPGSVGSHQDPPATWLTDLLAEAVLRGVPAPSLAHWLDAAMTTRRTTAVVLATMADQVDGLARELRDDYGLDAKGVLLQRIVAGEPLPRAVQRANLLVTTPANERRVRKLAERLNSPVVIACVRQDLLSVERLALMRRIAYVVVADPKFEAVVREFLRDAPSRDNVRVLVAGRDDLRVIPPDAPTYVTESARGILGTTRLPGRLVARARILTDDCVRELIRHIVERNLSPNRARR